MAASAYRARARSLYRMIMRATKTWEGDTTEILSVRAETREGFRRAVALETPADIAEARYACKSALHV